MPMNHDDPSLSDYSVTTTTTSKMQTLRLTPTLNNCFLWSKIFFGLHLLDMVEMFANFDILLSQYDKPYTIGHTVN